MERPGRQPCRAHGFFRDGRYRSGEGCQTVVCTALEIIVYMCSMMKPQRNLKLLFGHAKIFIGFFGILSLA